LTLKYGIAFSKENFEPALKDMRKGIEPATKKKKEEMTQEEGRELKSFTAESSRPPIDFVSLNLHHPNRLSLIVRHAWQRTKSATVEGI
jgi:hypothetical protein